MNGLAGLTWWFQGRSRLGPARLMLSRCTATRLGSIGQRSRRIWNKRSPALDFRSIISHILGLIAGLLVSRTKDSLRPIPRWPLPVSIGSRRKIQLTDIPRRPCLQPSNCARRLSKSVSRPVLKNGHGTSISESSGKISQVRIWWL